MKLYMSAPVILALCTCAGAVFAETQADSPVSEAPPADAVPAVDEPVADLPLVNAEVIATALETYFVGHDEPLAEEPSEQEPLPLTVDEAVALALEQNPSVAQAQSDASAARARIGQARSQARPQIGGQAGARYMDESGFDIGGRIASRVAERVIGDMSGSQTVTSETVSVSQVLFAGGQIRAAIRASEFLAESQQWQTQATLNEIAYDTREAYYNVLLARALEGVAQESVVTFERHLSDAQRMYDVGLISGFEVLRARTELGTRRSDAVAAANGVRLAKANLRRVLALPTDTPVRLVGGPDIPSAAEPVGVYIASARERRPELLALEQGVLAAEQNVRRARGQYWPRVAASADYNNTDGGTSFMAQEGFSATVGAEFEIYAGGRRKYEVVEARENLNSIRAQQEDVGNLVQLDVTRAYIQLQNAAAQVQSEFGNVELAREGLRLAELRFQEGVGTQTETLDASLALTSAESALVRALNGYAVAYAALQRAVGGALQPAVAPAPAETP